MRTFFKKTFVAVVLLLPFSAGIHADSIDTSALKNVLQARVDEGYTTGFMIGILENNQPQFISAGKGNKETNQQINEHSIFEIGSITKTFTGILLADMILKGEVELDDPVEMYLPKGVTLPANNGKKITSRHLATHTSGLPRIPDNMPMADMANPYADYSVQLMYDFLSGYTFTSELGKKVDYSNLGAGLLGHILALKAQTSYEELVTQRLLKPLGMNDTSITISAKQQQRLTVGHDIGGNAVKHWDLPSFAGAGALRSTGSDMMRYLTANMGVTESPLAAAIEMSHQFQYDAGPEGLSIGLFWFTKTEPESTVVWHNGGTGGYRSFIGWDKAKGRGVLALQNSWADSDLVGGAVLKNQLSLLKPEKLETISLSKEEMTRFVGAYQLAPAAILTISEEAGQLFVQLTGQPKIPTMAKSKDELLVKGVKASITFEENESGGISTLILHQGGRSQKANKLD